MLMTHKPIPPSLEPFVAYIVMARGRNVDGVVLISDYDVSGNGLETSMAAATSTPVRTTDSICSTTAKRFRGSTDDTGDALFSDASSLGISKKRL